MSLVLAFSSVSALAQGPIDPSKQIVKVEDISNQNLVIDGTRMVRAVNIQATVLTWDDPGTTYLSTGAFNGETTKLRISREGMGAGDQIMFQGWPYLRDKRGRVWAIDDSPLQSALTKLQPWASPWSVATNAWKGLAGGFLAALVMKIDQGTLQLLFDPNASGWMGFLGGWTLTYLGEAGLDLLKSHRKLGRGGNFFTKEIARNVTEIKEEIRADGNLDYVLKIKKGGNGIVEEKYLSDLVSPTNHKAPKYHSEDCAIFLRK